jgi:hypothetical protein
VHRPPGPHIIHYGIDWTVDWQGSGGTQHSYSFNKLLYLTLDATSCPRWFMPLAPFVSGHETTGAGGRSYRDALCGKQIANFNAALCGYYGQHCQTPPICPPEDAEAARRLPAAERCVDLSQNCLSWARMGECDKNPGFMRDECAQSCGMCAPRFARPMLGAPTTTCFDEQGETSCRGLAALGACATQRMHMLESCRSTCEFCNSSRDAFMDSNGHGKEDTAQHTCPDGSDLGGGKTLINSKGAELNALAASEHDAETAADSEGGDAGARNPITAAPRTIAAAARRPTATGMSAGAGGRSGGGGQGGEGAGTAAAADSAVPRGVRPVIKQEPVSLPGGGLGGGHTTPGGAATLDVSLSSWPFLLVQSLLLILVGYILRGFRDRSTKRRRLFTGAGPTGLTSSHSRGRGLNV